MSSLIKLLGLQIDKPEYRRLWWQIMATIIAFSVLPLVLLGAVIYFQFSASYNAAITDNLKTLAENRRSSLDLFFDERVAQLVTLANTHSLDRIKDEEYLNRVFNTMQTKSRSFLDLGVIDQEGNHLAYVGPGPFYSILKGVNYKNEDWFIAAMSSGIYISDVFLGFRKVPHFIIAVVVREKGQNLILRATIDSDVIDNIVHAAWTGKTGDAYLINGQSNAEARQFDGSSIERPLPASSRKSVKVPPTSMPMR